MEYRMEEYEQQNGPFPGHKRSTAGRAPRGTGGVRVRWAIVLPNAARSTAQGSIRLGLGLG